MKTRWRTWSSSCDSSRRTIRFVLLRLLQRAGRGRRRSPRSEAAPRRGGRATTRRSDLQRRETADPSPHAKNPRRDPDAGGGDVTSAAPLSNSQNSPIRGNQNVGHRAACHQLPNQVCLLMSASLFLFFHDAISDARKTAAKNIFAEMAPSKINSQPSLRIYASL